MKVTGAMEKISITTVPHYLRSGALYDALDSDDEEPFEVPAPYLKQDLTINCEEDVERVLSSLRFWAVDKIPRELLHALFEGVGTLQRLLKVFGNDLPYLKSVMRIVREEDKKKMIILAAESGFVDVLSFVHLNLVRGWMIPEVCEATVRAGSFDNLRYAHENKFSWNEHTCRLAAELGHLDCLMYAHFHDCPWDESCTAAAATAGNFECLKFACEHGCPWTKQAVVGATTNGHYLCLEYALTNGCPIGSDSWACIKAAAAGYLDCLRCLHEHGSPWMPLVCSSAAANGHLDCLEYAHTHGCPWNWLTCENAARSGHLDCLKYAYEHGCRLGSSQICIVAASKGQLACLEYAHANGGTMDERVCCAAASAGKLDCLKFAHAQGVHCTEWTAISAAGNLSCLQYVIEVGHCSVTAGLMKAAVSAGEGKCIEYLREKASWM